MKLHENEPEKQNHINWKYYEKVADVLYQFQYFRDARIEEPSPRRPSELMFMKKKTLALDEEDSRKFLLAVKGIGLFFILFLFLFFKFYFILFLFLFLFYFILFLFFIFLFFIIIFYSILFIFIFIFIYFFHFIYFILFF